jgi:hypothetical protein
MLKNAKTGELTPLGKKVIDMWGEVSGEGNAQAEANAKKAIALGYFTSDGDITALGDEHGSEVDAIMNEGNKNMGNLTDSTEGIPAGTEGEEVAQDEIPDQD